jgi:release factor glutamine methyltransferase
MTIQQALHDFVAVLTPQYGEGEARSMSRIVFEDYFNIKPNNENDENVFQTFLKEDFETIKARILRGEPVQYVVGFAWFYGLKFKVNNSVLIPRPETEELVEWVLEIAKTFKKTHKNVKILDIGTGSGCIPVTLKVKNPDLEVSAVDISESALITASRNAYRHGAEIDFKRIDILDTSAWDDLGNFDIIVSNPPYIPHAEKALMEGNVLNFEPHLALFVDDDDTLIFYEKIADFALKHLDTCLSDRQAERVLFFECNQYNAQDVVKMLQSKGFKNVELRKDMSGNDRMVKGGF